RPTPAVGPHRPIGQNGREPPAIRGKPDRPQPPTRASGTPTAKPPSFPARCPTLTRAEESSPPPAEQAGGAVAPLAPPEADAGTGILRGASRAEIRERFDEIVAFAGLDAFIDNPVKTYSSGMYMRLGFAIAVTVDPDILLIDEVLAVGDEAFQHKCVGKIQE